MNSRVVLALVASIALAGCVTDLFDGNKPLPSEILAELTVQQASLIPFEHPLPQSVSHYVLEGEPLTVNFEIELAFLPLASELKPENEGDYYYSFSKSSGLDGEFEVLISRKFNIDGQEERYFQRMYRGVPRNGMEDIPDIADTYLTDNPLFIPVAATHIELRFLPNSSTDYILEQRLPLDSFFVWERYISPVFVPMR